ncbi:MAG: radical SAM protein [PVC group bacterium]|nr:radical SAM protein [PVC group bacterium]
MQIDVSEQKITTILRPTGINLAPYVINPYQGCQLGCLFCYAQFSKVARREGKPWGSYVKVKVNALEVLERELDVVQPKKVLLGSTTECFQPVEKKHKLTEAILEVLNKREIPYVILTRSLLIGDYIPLLKKGKCEAVYFTIDTLPENIRQKFQPYACSVKQSIDILNKLIENKINVIAYFCPIMPWLFECEDVFTQVRGVDKAEFEIMNFKMAGMDKIISCIKDTYPEQVDNYMRLAKDSGFYEGTIGKLKECIDNAAKGCFKDIKIHNHGFEDFFQNVY